MADLKLQRYCSGGGSKNVKTYFDHEKHFDLRIVCYNKSVLFVACMCSVFCIHLIRV